MPHLKPDNTPAYLVPSSSPLHSAARLQRDAEIKREWLWPLAKLLIFSALAGLALAMRS